MLARRTTLPPRRTTALGVRVDCEGGRRSEVRMNESAEGSRAEAASASRRTHRPAVPSPLTTPGCLRPHSCPLSSTPPPTGTRPLSLSLPTPVSHPGRRCPAGRSASIASVTIGGMDPLGRTGHARARAERGSPPGVGMAQRAPEPDAATVAQDDGDRGGWAAKVRGKDERAGRLQGGRCSATGVAFGLAPSSSAPPSAMQRPRLFNLVSVEPPDE
ncbi:hypothetical protein BJ912DRAFT_972136, partial [Pholiota molesta]